MPVHPEKEILSGTCIKVDLIYKHKKSTLYMPAKGVIGDTKPPCLNCGCPRTSIAIVGGDGVGNAEDNVDHAFPAIPSH